MIMKKGVSKLEFVKSLEETLKLTRVGIKELLLKDDGNTITVVYQNGYERDINIAMNSALAIIEDVVTRLY